MQKINASPNITTIVPDDNNAFVPPLLGIRIGVSGDIRIRSGNEDVTISSAQIGETIPGEINKVYATGTTANGLIGWRWD